MARTAGIYACGEYFIEARSYAPEGGVVHEKI